MRTFLLTYVQGGGSGWVETKQIEAATAEDALTMFRTNVRAVGNAFELQTIRDVTVEGVDGRALPRGAP